MHISFVTEAPMKWYGPPVSTSVLLCQSTIVHSVSRGKSSVKIDNFTSVSVSTQSMSTGGGATLGAREGPELGSEDGLIADGAIDGLDEVMEVGDADGSAEGFELGSAEGPVETVGTSECAMEGSAE
jgi:hypothetical protein